MIRDCQRCPALGRSIFNVLDDQLFARIHDTSSTRAFATGAVLCREGDEAHGVHCLQAGAVKLTRTGESGEIQMIRLLGSAGTIGLAPVLEGAGHSTQATALSGGAICTIPRDTIHDLVRRSTDFAFTVMKYLSHELRISEDFLIAITQRPVRRRVAEVLLLLHGHAIEGDDWTPLPTVRLKRKEIAQMVAATPETVSRMLAEFAKLDLILMTRTHLELLDPESLQSMVHEDTPLS